MGWISGGRRYWLLSDIQYPAGYLIMLWTKNYRFSLNFSFVPSFIIRKKAGTLMKKKWKKIAIFSSILLLHNRITFNFLFKIDIRPDMYTDIRYPTTTNTWIQQSICQTIRYLSGNWPKISIRPNPRHNPSINHK